VECSQ